MTTNDDFDRTLAGWFEAESRSGGPVVGVERVLDRTRQRQPRPAWLAWLGSRWVGEAPAAGLGTRRVTLPGHHLRWSTVAVLLVLGLAIAGGALLAGGVLPRWPAPGDAGSLAYILDGTLYLADSDGRNSVGIAGATRSGDTCDIVHLEGGMWSPDGRHLAYRSGWGTGCTPTVHIADAEGTAVTAFSAGLGWKVEWAPDSRRVVSWGMADGTIAVHGVDGVLQAEARLPEGFCVCGDYDPTWAPGGESVLVKSLLIPLNGDEPGALWGGQPGGILLGVRDPSTSADGTLVAFVASGSLYLAPVDHLAEGRVLVADPDLMDAGVAIMLSPAGDKVAVAASRSPVSDQDSDTVSATFYLLVVDVASGEMTTLVSASGISAISPLAFSPAGDRILFRQVAATWADSSLWSVRTDGSDARMLVAGADWGDWRPSPAGP